MKTSFITTVLNEEKTIHRLLSSLKDQTQQPDEIIISDGGSTDNTVQVIEKFQQENKQLPISLIIKKGNRSVGRNAAVEKAEGDVILCTDAGCYLKNDWIEQMVRPFANSAVDVVAGYYKGDAKTVFQKCLIPYVLVMPDRVDPNNFLPATRSIAFRKSIWQKIDRFPERYSHNEDYVFAQRLKESGAHIIFQRSAIVYWIPRETCSQAFRMFWRFAYGDMEARIIRKKVIALFLRYSIGILLLAYLVTFRQVIIFYSILLLILLYGGWAVGKNYRYVKDMRAFVYLPLLQFTADFAVLSGSIAAIIDSWDTHSRR